MVDSEERPQSHVVQWLDIAVLVDSSEAGPDLDGCRISVAVDCLLLSPKGCQHRGGVKFPREYSGVAVVSRDDGDHAELASLGRDG